ncbi:hypothetical protein TCAL_16665 [Tigriopus californicus]|uniref:Uncharacterized protein n=1 Tax=Tigriopus californicus TaxID=6832 RepID=A0A553NDK4_TIGCA|nr:hypothetical protein TCAL_16665 [Tigriopus californicus]
MEYDSVSGLYSLTSEKRRRGPLDAGGSLAASSFTSKRRRFRMLRVIQTTTGLTTTCWAHLSTESDTDDLAPPFSLATGIGFF